MGQRLDFDALIEKALMLLHSFTTKGKVMVPSQPSYKGTDGFIPLKNSKLTNPF